MAKDNLEKQVDELTDKASKKQKGSLDQLLLLKKAAAILAMIERQISKMNKAIAKAAKSLIELEEKRKEKKADKQRKKEKEEKKQEELKANEKQILRFINEDKENERKKLMKAISLQKTHEPNKPSVIPDYLNATESLSIVESLKNSTPKKTSNKSSINHERPNL